MAHNQIYVMDDSSPRLMNWCISKLHYFGSDHIRKQFLYDPLCHLPSTKQQMDKLTWLAVEHCWRPKTEIKRE